MTSSDTQEAKELRDMIRALEELQAKAVKNGHQFLAYLIDMARLEAVALLHKQRP